MSSDFYATLGISSDASPQDIKKAYRRMSKELHPDKHKGDKAREQKFKEINEAYETLSDPAKRRTYDQFGKAGPGGAGAGGFDFSGFSGARPEDFGGFSDLFETFFGGSGQKASRQQQRGRDLEVRVRIAFMESVTGVQKKLSLERLIACADCSGSGAAKGSSLVTCIECAGTGQVTRTAQSFFGAIRQSVLCPKCSGSGKFPEKKCAGCDGEGRVRRKEEIDMDIPAGIDDGQTVRLRGYGEAGRNGSPSGDLFVHVEVTPDPRFARNGNDVYSARSITVPDAALGADLPVETVQGSVSLRIPPATQSGQVLRIRGKGMPHVHSKSHGDHYVTIEVRIPEKLSREERRILEEWRDIAS
jgi:molecular chaperone DnaJ